MNLNYQNILCQILIACIQFLILIIPFLGTANLYDNRRRWQKKLSVRGYLIIGLGLSLAFLTIFQNTLDEAINTEKDKEFNTQLQKRDSVNSSQNKSDNLKVVNLLAKYGYEVKMRNDRIEEVLHDTITRKANYYNAPDPNVFIKDIQVENDGLKKINFITTLISTDATSYDVSLKLDIFYISKTNKYFYLIKDYSIIHRKLNKDISIEPIIPAAKPTFAKDYLFHLTGSFKKNLKTEDRIQINDIYLLYQRKNRYQFAIPGNTKIDSLNNYLKSYRRVTKNYFKK